MNESAGPFGPALSFSVSRRCPQSIGGGRGILHILVQPLDDPVHEVELMGPLTQPMGFPRINHEPRRHTKNTERLIQLL